MHAWEQTYDLPSGGGVAIDQAAGGVKVMAWDQPVVRVRAASESENLPERMLVQSNAGGLRVEVKPERSGFLGFLSSSSPVHLDLMVPRGTRLQVESGAGPIDVSGTGAAVDIESGSGPIALAEIAGARLETGSGMVTARRVSGTVHLESGSGMVEMEQIVGGLHLEVGSGRVSVRQVAGDVYVESGSGQIDVADVSGSVSLEPGSGSVNVDRVKGASLRVDSGGGTIVLNRLAVEDLYVDSAAGGVKVDLAAVDPLGSYRIDCSSGGVQVALPADAGLQVRLESESGRITYDGLDLRVAYHEDGELKGTLNGGGAKLSVETGSGGIRLLPAAPESEAPLIKVIRQDAALENSEQMRRVLAMVAEGKLSPEEAEEILRALDEEEASV